MPPAALPAHQTTSACALLLAWSIVLLACNPSPPCPPNVLMITIDTLRADHLGASGFAPAHTPTLDQLARQGWFFADAMAPAPLTLPSHSSLFTGLLPATHGVRDNEPYPLPPDVETLAEVLHGHGYQTGAVIGGEPLARGCGLEQGFDQYDSPDRRHTAGSITFRERTATEVAAAGMEWLQAARQPFLLWLHFFDPHAPYRPPAAYLGGSASAYDGEVAYVDDQIGRVLAKLEDLRRRDHTLIVVAADHGESLGEHGEATHGFLVYQSTLRVPLLFCGPGVPAARRDARVARLIDVFPTILQVLGVPLGGSCQGVSLIANDPGAAMGESLYASHHFGWAQLTCVRRGALKHIEGSETEDYDLAADPREQEPLAPGAARDQLASELARCKRLERMPPRAPTLAAPIGYLGSPARAGGLRFLPEPENLTRRSPPASMALAQRFLEGVEAAGQAQWNRALVELSAVQKEDPSNPAFRWWTARALEQIGEHEHAPAMVQQAVDLYDGLAGEGQIDALNLGLKARSFGLGRWQEAIARGESTLNAGMGNADTLRVLGLIHLDPHNPARNVQRGLDLLRQAVTQRPDDLPALQALEDAYTNAGLEDLARATAREIERLEAGAR